MYCTEVWIRSQGPEASNNQSSSENAKLHHTRSYSYGFPEPGHYCLRNIMLCRPPVGHFNLGGSKRLGGVLGFGVNSCYLGCDASVVHSPCCATTSMPIGGTKINLAFYSSNCSHCFCFSSHDLYA